MADWPGALLKLVGILTLLSILGVLASAARLAAALAVLLDAGIARGEGALDVAAAVRVLR